jgi:hypothetical protein
MFIPLARSIIVCGLPICGFSVLLCHAEQPHATKEGKITIAVNLLGTRSAAIEKIYGLPDKRLDLLRHKSSLGEGERSEKESWEYTSRGFTFEFRDDKLHRINAMGGFEGEIDRICIGDSEKTVIRKKGMPDGKPTSSRWTYKQGHTSKGWVIYIDFDDAGKVKRICTLANPHKHTGDPLKGRRENHISDKR